MSQSPEHPHNRADLGKDPARVSGMFDQVAPAYDRTNTVLSLGQDKLWRVATTRAVAPRPGQRILDLAAGSLRAEGGVETGADGGAISSENLRVDPPGGAGEARRFSFGNGVRLRYDPPAASR